MSLPYHIGNGWFGGFLPFLAAALVVLTGNIYYGLWYPIAIAAMSGIVGLIGLAGNQGRRHPLMTAGAGRTPAPRPRRPSARCIRSRLSVPEDCASPSAPRRSRDCSGLPPKNRRLMPSRSAIAGSASALRHRS